MPICTSKLKSHKMKISVHFQLEVHKPHHLPWEFLLTGSIKSINFPFSVKARIHPTNPFGFWPVADPPIVRVDTNFILDNGSSGLLVSVSLPSSET